MRRSASSPKLSLPGAGTVHAPVIDNKTEPPVTDGLVARSKLLKILDSAPARAVIWVAAAPGAGKSSLAATWIDARRAAANVQSIWYGLDDGDHDPIGFLAHLRRALAQGLDIDIDTLPRFTPEAAAEIRPFARRWFGDLRARTRQPWLFAFDDMHRLPETSATWQLFEAMLGVQKAHDRITFLSRGEPPEILKSVKPGKRLVEITDLRVRPDEFDDFAHIRTAGETLTRETFGDWVRRTGGWISELSAGSGRRASLQVFAGGNPAHAGAMGQFASSERTMLLQTAFLQSGSEAEWQASGGAEAVALLQRLATETGLVSRRTNGSLRKHDLFHAHLIQAATQSLPPGILNQARMATASILAARQEYRSSVQLMVEAGAIDAARDLVVGLGPVLNQFGRNRELMDLVASLPEAVRAEPEVRIWDAYGRMAFEPWVAQRTFHEVRLAASPQSQPITYALAICGEIQAALNDWTEHRHLPPLIEEIDRNRLVLEALPPALQRRIAIARSMTLMFAWPTHPDILQTRQQIEAMLPGLPPAEQLLLGAALVTYLSWWCSDVRAARTFRDMLSPLARRTDMMPRAVMLWQYGAISCAHRAGDGGMVQRLTNEAMTFAEKWGVTSSLYNIFWLNVVAYADAGDRTNAVAMLQRYVDNQAHWGRTNLIATHHLRALIALSAGDEIAAISEARQARAYAEAQNRPHQIASQDKVLAMALAVQGDAAALTHIGSLRYVAGQTHNANFRLHAALAEAVLAYAQGRDGDFRRLWSAMARAALELGERRISGMNRNYLARVANFALMQQADVTTTRRLIALWQLSPPAIAASDSWPYPVEIRTLGAFAITIDGQPATSGQVKAGRKPLELLWHLLAAGDDALAHADLADSLWPELEGDRAMHTLQTTIYRLRKLFPAEAIRNADDRIWLNTAIVRTDLMALRQALAQLQEPTAAIATRLAALDRALQLYQGAFLPGVQLPAIQAERQRIVDTLAREGRALLRTQDRTNPMTALREARLRACIDPAG